MLAIDERMVGMGTEKPLIGVGETAARFKVDPTTLRIWLRKGQCPVAPIPGMKPPKWRASDVDAFLAGDAAR